MYRNNVIYDIFLLFVCVYIIKTFLLKKTLSKKELFLINHSKPWLRITVIIAILMQISYIFLCDIGIFSGILYTCISSLLLFTVLMTFAMICFLKWRYGAKDWETRYETEMIIEGIIVIIFIYVMIHLFQNVLQIILTPQIQSRLLNFECVSTEEQERHDYAKQVKKSGLLSGGLGFTIGTEKRKDQYSDADLLQKASIVGSVSCNVSIESGNKVEIGASAVLAGYED